jgi:hypothetical protein
MAIRDPADPDALYRLPARRDMHPSANQIEQGRLFDAH